MKICKDCKYFFGGDKCTRDTSISLVDGNKYFSTRYCDTEREGGILLSIIKDRCGRYGRFFERRE